MPYTTTIYIWLYGLFNVFKDISLMIWPLFRSLGRNLSNFSVVFWKIWKIKKTFWNYLTFSWTYLFQKVFHTHVPKSAVSISGDQLLHFRTEIKMFMKTKLTGSQKLWFDNYFSVVIHRYSVSKSSWAYCHFNTFLAVHFKTKFVAIFRHQSFTIWTWRNGGGIEHYANLQRYQNSLPVKNPCKGSVSK